MGKSCWDCIHCDVCANIDGFSHHVSDVSKCKRFKDKADVEPVKHGEWVNNDNEWKFYKCSICGNEAYWDTDYGQQLFDFCPWCGAKMDGKEVQE